MELLVPLLEEELGMYFFMDMIIFLLINWLFRIWEGGFSGGFLGVIFPCISTQKN